MAANDKCICGHYESIHKFAESCHADDCTCKRFSLDGRAQKARRPVPRNQCVCGHDKGVHRYEISSVGGPTLWFECGDKEECNCEGFSLVGPAKKPKTVTPNDIPQITAHLDEAFSEQLGGLTSRVENLLDEFDQKVDFSEEPTGSLTLIFREVTAEEVRGILSGALKDNNKLYSMMYSTNDESELYHG